MLSIYGFIYLIRIGDDRAVSSVHKDPYENIYCVTHGSKQFILLPPTDTPYLYRKNYKMAQYKADLSLKDLEGEVPWIPVDPEYPDLNKYPLFEHASPIEVNLDQGDVLYLPSLWYHKVKQSSGQDKRTIAVNFWYDMQFDARFTWTVFQDKILNTSS
jgi:jumonji domain-containing protein 7